MSDEQKPTTEHEETGLHIPIWVALAALAVALILAGIIMSNVLGTLVDLVFPEAVDVPLPSGAVEIDHIEDSKTADEEWLYGVDEDACRVSWFYQEAGASCNFMPTMCDVGEDNIPYLIMDEPAAMVARCTGEKPAEVSGYSYEVLVSTGSADYQTYFRVYVYKER
ncbi:MAG: hypothetical protein KJ064_22775 [Anaerolineae bacterium]|jgi:hypothetical protein|nr:MAG: hypothetical protein F9K27_14750 [Anaerolineae bacterium]MCL4879500.1 hypothetical protein [Anaerolineae bacterium]